MQGIHTRRKMYQNESKIAKLETEYIKNKSAAALGELVKLSKMGKYDMKNLRKKMKQVSESDQIDEKKKKKKKSSGKKDACYHKVKIRYDVWPSAYASGALVKCRKVGAKNWGNKSKNEEIELEEIYLTEEKMELTPENLEKILRDEGGASGMDPFIKAIDATEEEIKKALDDMKNVGQHEDGDYILEDGEEIDVLEEKKRKFLGRICFVLVGGDVDGSSPLVLSRCSRSSWTSPPWLISFLGSAVSCSCSLVSDR